MNKSVSELARDLVKALEGRRCPACGGRLGKGGMHFADCEVGARLELLTRALAQEVQDV